LVSAESEGALRSKKTYTPPTKSVKSVIPASNPDFTAKRRHTAKNASPVHLLGQENRILRFAKSVGRLGLRLASTHAVCCAGHREHTDWRLGVVCRAAHAAGTGCFVFQSAPRRRDGGTEIKCRIAQGAT
jgi:hypothetical protein